MLGRGYSLLPFIFANENFTLRRTCHGNINKYIPLKCYLLFGCFSLIFNSINFSRPNIIIAVIAMLKK